MVRYEVTCWSPPSQLKIGEGDNVIVEGLVNEQKKLITADSIENLTAYGPTCNCQSPTPKAVDIRAQVEEMKAKGVKARKKGTVGHITVDSEFIEFKLEVP